MVAASTVGYRMMPAQTLRQLMADPRIAARVLASIAEAKCRVERHVTVLGRLDSRSRIAALLIGIYDRLRRADLIPRATFNLHLSQDQIGDHLGMTMVHVSRTLKRMREERLAIDEVERLRHVAAAELPPIATDPDVAKEMGRTA